MLSPQWPDQPSVYKTPWNVRARLNRQRSLSGLQISFPPRIFSKWYRIPRMHGWTTDQNKRHQQVNSSWPLCYVHVGYPWLTESKDPCSHSLLHDRSAISMRVVDLYADLVTAAFTMFKSAFLLRPGWNYCLDVTCHPLSRKRPDISCMRTC